MTKQGTMGNDDANEPLFIRAMRRAAHDTTTRWATYRLPAVTVLSEYADYADAANKRREVAIERSAIEKDLSKTVTAIARGMAGRSTDETDRQARAILAGQPEEAFAGFEELRDKQVRLTERLKSYGQAVRMQDEVVATIRSERSIDAAEIMAPVHRDAVLAIADAIAQLREAFDREEACRSLVTQAGYDGRLPVFGGGVNDRAMNPLDETERRAREYAR